MRAMPEFWKVAGDLAYQARSSFAHGLAKADLVFDTSLEWMANGLERELGQGGASPLESLLIKRIVVTWVELYGLDMLVAQKGAALHPGALEALDLRRLRAHKRYLTAIRELAQVRRLLVPPIRVNVDARTAHVARPELPPKSGALRGGAGST